MAAELVEVTVWILVDENGDYVATDDVDSLAERYDEVIDGADMYHLWVIPNGLPCSLFNWEI